MPESSIIIPVYNNWDLTRACLKSIAANTDKDKIEVIVVDNASTDATQKGCPFLGRQLFGDSFRYIRNDVNRNFAGASNQGAEAASGEYLIFLNNDTEVQPGWYQPLVDDFRTYPDLAATGPLLVYPDETPLGRLVQHLGVYVNPFNQLGHYHEGIPQASPLAHKRRFFQAITAACMVVKKQLFLEAGKFNEEFINGFEDVDLCARLGAKGLRMTVNPESLVVHHESRSEGRHDHEAHNSALLTNSSLKLLKPDRHLLLKDDGLRLRISKWFIIQNGMDPDDEAKLDPQAAGMGAEELKKALVENPYWQKGWLDLLERTGQGEERSKLWRLYLELFHDADNALALAALPWADQEQGLLAECAKYLRFCAAEPESSLNYARAGFKWSLEHRIGEMAEQFGDFIKRFDKFRDRDFPRLARELWRLENRPGIPHAPNDDISYLLWRHLVDSGNREKALADFYRQAAAAPEAFPQFSILMPVYNPGHGHLRAALDSVLAQTYQGWELCVADDASTDPEIMNILREYAGKDARIHVTGRESNGRIAAATNTALAMATHPWIALLDQDDLLTPDALAFMAQAIKANPQGTLFFSDEDKLESGQFLNPHLKNGKWDWELIPVQNYVCHLAVYNTERLRAIGGLREGFEGAQDHDLVLRYAANSDPSAFVHVPHVLYHWRIHAGSTAKSLGAKSYALESGEKAAQEWLDMHEPGAKVEALQQCVWPRIKYPLPQPFPSASLIYAISEPAFPLVKYAGEWREKTRRNIELIFVCHEKDHQALNSSLHGVANKDRVKLLACPDAWSDSQLLQLGADSSGGEILGFIGDGIVPANDEWLDEIVSCLWRAQIGAVGGAVYNSDGALAHGGYLTDAGGGLKRTFAGVRPHSSIWFGWTRLARTVDALDSLCLFTKAAIFRESGGFAPEMGDWAAQDYCLRLGASGLRTVWWPFAEFLKIRPGKSFFKKSIERFAQNWQGKLTPANPSLLALGDGWQLNDPGDKSYDFSPDEYLRLYPDVSQCGIDPLKHYLGGGIGEGRKGRLSQIDWSRLTPERIESWKKAPKTAVVVCTSLCGDYETLLPPAFLNDGWEYVCFSDKQRETWGIWDIRPIPYENGDLTRKSRWAKMNLPSIFPDADWVFWLDANIVINGDLSPLLENRDERGLYMVKHPVRNCVIEETGACIASKRDDPALLERQAQAYIGAGMPRNFGMWENNFFLLNPKSKKVSGLSQQWWEEYGKYSRRDQLSLPFVFFRNNFRPGMLLAGNKNARNWPDLTFLTHEEAAWMAKPRLKQRADR